jgi:hypothetical protein
MVLMTPGKTMAEAFRVLQVIQELDDFNLRCWFLNNNKLVLEYCAIFQFVLLIIILCYP